MGPDQMLPLVAQLRELTCLPIIVNPNAGLPESVNGETVYNVDPEAFAEKMEAIAKLGSAIWAAAAAPPWRILQR